MKSNKIERNLKTVGQWLGKFMKRITKIIIFELFKCSTVQSSKNGNCKF